MDGLLQFNHGRRKKSKKGTKAFKVFFSSRFINGLINHLIFFFSHNQPLVSISVVVFLTCSSGEKTRNKAKMKCFL